MSTIHDNSKSKKINKSTVEPRDKPQGVWIPMPIWEMTNDGRLSFLDLRLLMRINGYVTAKGAGCWASNGKLAEETGVTRNHAATRIAFLKSLGLVIEVGTVTIGNLKRKLLETSWSCVFPGQQDPKLKRKAVRDAVRETLTKKNTQITVTLYKREVTYTTDRIATYTTDRIATYTTDRIQSNNDCKSIKGEKPRSRFSISDDDFTTTEERHADETSKLVNGFHFGSDEKQSKKKSNPVIDKKYINAHKRLREILHSAEPTRYVSPMGKKAGAEQIRLLCEINLQGDFEIIEDVLEDYADCINDIPKPSIINAKQFREQFSWLQSEIGKLKGYVNGRPYNGI